MSLAVKQGRKIGIFLKPNVPTDKNSFVEREVYVTLQGSKTGKETKVKLKINAGRRHAPIQSSSGAVTLSESGQIVETFNPSQIKEEIEEVEKVEEIIEKMEELEKEKIIDPSPEVEEEIEKQMQIIEEIASGENLSATSAQKKAAKATQTAVQKSQAKAAALSEKLASKGITKKSASKTTQRKDPSRKKKGGLTLMG